MYFLGMKVCNTRLDKYDPFISWGLQISSWMYQPAKLFPDHCLISSRELENSSVEQ
jgi:hypothetical protein